ncbi:hypothetical protein HXX02_07360 [Microbulbifer elongatus]|uniref:Lipocalin-like domain-containing protein n=1 Tax=Microbulbifer elongatus TaxID=86173 RepID=A0ABT1P2N8_9GAMM|nr:hypothetical protein [Microbulbifer elongatus]MCQ3829259.1 hypothetical protein [Microbulbifer elongatus]
MKKTVLALALSLISSFASADNLTGAWELVSGSYVDNKGTLLDYQELDFKALKIISDRHFSFTSMKGGKFWASGTGTYEVADGKYTETLHFNSFGEQSGAKFVFTTRVEDEYWYNERWKDGERVEYEVWRRVE